MRAPIESSRAACRALIACTLLALPGCHESEPGSRPSAIARGRSLYRTGVARDGQSVRCEVGHGTQANAAALPCLQCHGVDGRGKSEGGIAPSDIRLASLTRPYAIETASGRRRLAYSAHLIERALTEGLDSAGKQLDPAMPRYHLDPRSAADLVLYLGTVGDEPESGVNSDSVRIGFASLTGPLEQEARAAEISLRELFDAINDQGGIYQRRIELVSFAVPGERDAQRSAIDDFLRVRVPFALASLSALDFAEPSVAAANEPQIPVVAISALVNASEPQPRNAFYLFGPVRNLLPDGAAVSGHEFTADAARAAGHLMIQGLLRVGRDLRRASFIEAIESIHDLRVAGMPALSFDRARHVGAPDVELAFDPREVRLRFARSLPSNQESQR